MSTQLCKEKSCVMQHLLHIHLLHSLRGVSAKIFLLILLNCTEHVNINSEIKEKKNIKKIEITSYPALSTSFSNLRLKTQPNIRFSYWQAQTIYKLFQTYQQNLLILQFESNWVFLSF